MRQFAAVVLILATSTLSLAFLDGRARQARETKIDCLTKGNWHNGKVVELVEARLGRPVTELTELDGLVARFSRDDARIAWHHAMSLKYWNAASRPWFARVGGEETPPPPGYRPPSS